MFDQKIIDEILRRTYNAYFKNNEPYNIEVCLREEQWDESVFRKTIDYIIAYEQYIRATTAGGNHKITARGISYAEIMKIVPIESISANKLIRIRILEALVKKYDDSSSMDSGIHIQTLVELTGVEVLALVSNLQYLVDSYFIQTINGSFFKINLAGIKEAKELKERVELINEFDRIAILDPHPRGKALQKIFARVVEQSYWEQQEGARTSNEEMDVIFHKGREYFLVECKWEKNPVGAEVIRELFGKLSNRIGVQGIVVSMSGFIKGAIKQAQDYINSRSILFFGSTDVTQLVNEKDYFDTLLDKKYNQLITKRDIVFE